VRGDKQKLLATSLGVGGGAVRLAVVFLDLLAVIACAVGHPEEPLFNYRVPAVPQGQGRAEARLVIGAPGQAVFPPALGKRAWSWIK
jgi:hypothetical protein